MLEIKNKLFTYVYGYKENKNLRYSFNNLTQRIYGFDFEKWYQNGYWQDTYIPHSLVFEDAIVANLSVSIINFELFGEKRKYLQIGTVMTAPEFRGMGLSRFLMEKIMTEWKNKCDLIYLFANDSVLSFYPQFGFKKADEYQLSQEVESKFLQTEYRQKSTRLNYIQKLNMDDNRNRLTIIEKIKRAKPLSQLFMTDNIGLIMFYLTSFLKDNVYYIAKHDTYVIFEIDGDVIYLQDVFGGHEVSLDDIIRCLITKETKKVKLGFTPECEQGFEKNLLQEEDTTLFVFGKDVERFRDNKVMFPILSRA
ncbi:MAG: GNAT family N-acetyltransferase [Lachnospiraceae bacterium]|nr:GNAT family N-acetyltransferase [Lachnospiraceae bacterium]